MFPLSPAGPIEMARTRAAVLAAGLLCALTARAATEPGTPVRALVVADQETTLASQMSGRILDLPRRPGDAAKQGETLVKFECAEPKARVDMAKAELQAARLQHEAKLRLQGLKSASELDVELAAAAVDKARGQLALTQAELERCTITAPFAGRVAKWHVKPHQTLAAGQPIVDLVADGKLRLRLNVPSAWLAWLKPGYAFEVAIEETGVGYPLKLDRIHPRVDAVSQTVEVEAVFTGDTAGLLPGMSGSARLARTP